MTPSTLSAASESRAVALPERSILGGLASISFRHLDPIQIVNLVMRAGLQSIEWGGDIHVPHGDLARAREVREMTLDQGLLFGPYGSYYRAGDSEGEGLSFEAVLDSATTLGVPLIRVWGGGRAWVEGDDAYINRVIDDLRRITAMAAKRDILVCCECHSGSLTQSVSSTLEILRRVDHPNLRTHWQPTHGDTMENSIGELTHLAPWLFHVHVFHWWPDSNHRHLLSDGEERWSCFFQKMAHIASLRFAMLEFAKGDDPDIFLHDAAILTRLLKTSSGGPADAAG